MGNLPTKRNKRLTVSNNNSMESNTGVKGEDEYESSLSVFSSIPKDLVLEILYWLEPEAAARLGIVCKTFLSVSRDDVLWKRFVHAISPQQANICDSWLETYRELVSLTWVPKPTDRIRVEDRRTLVYEDSKWYFCKTNRLRGNRKYAISTQCADNKNAGLVYFGICCSSFDSSPSTNRSTGRWTWADNGAVCDGGSFTFTNNKMRFKAHDVVTVLFDKPNRTVSFLLNDQPVKTEDRGLIELKIPDTYTEFCFIAGICTSQEKITILSVK